jgi:hypothetical protein
MSLKRWLYRGGRPNRVAKILNNGWAILHSLGLFPNYLVTLEVVGRQSGKIIKFPLVLVVVNKERYLVSMLGEKANWVLNLKATDGKATLRHGKSEEVILEEVDVSQRAEIIKAYLHIAPGARGHIPVEKDASISEFEEIAPRYPVFKIITQKK